MTTRIGRSYLRANSKSRWSWAGTAMTAPVPYSISTKLADPDRHALAVERIDGVAAGDEAFLLDCRPSVRARSILRAGNFDRSRNCRLAPATVEQAAATSGCSGASDHEGRAVDRVDARGEDLDAARRGPSSGKSHLARLRTGRSSCAASSALSPASRVELLRCSSSSSSA